MKATLMKTFLSNFLPCAALVLGLVAPEVRAFSLGGPYPSWQVTGIGYQLPGDINGPMNLHDGFRWNAPVLTYALDQSFIDYFGPDGVKAIDEAFQYFSDLDSASKIPADLSEYSTSVARQNYEAAALGIIDLKSTAMSLIMEQLGFADPIRFAFTLRSRSVRTVGMISYTNYATIMRNFDPVTFNASPYVNGTLYTFANHEYAAPLNYADADESVVGDITAALETTPVATGFGISSGSTLLSASFSGRFFSGLSRDDVGGLRFLLHPNTFANESLLPTVTSAGAVRGDGWIPFYGVSNAVNLVSNLVFLPGSTGTNLTNGGLIVTALRGGRNHYKFKRLAFDSLLGTFFTPFTNSYSDTSFSNYTAVVQQVQRGQTRPDFIFVAEDIGLAANLVPVLTSRSGTGSWVNNDAINGSDDTANSSGPGTITPQVRISFSNVLPYFLTDNLDNESPGEYNASGSFVWGSFGGGTNSPIIYPFNSLLTLPQLRKQVLNPAAGQP